MSEFLSVLSEKQRFLCHEPLNLSKMCRICTSDKSCRTYHSCKFSDKAIFERCDRCDSISFSNIWLYFHKKKCVSNFNLSVKRLANKLMSKIINNDKTEQLAKASFASFKCDYCDFKTALKNSFKIHLAQKHYLLGSRPVFKCDQCNFETVYKTNLKIHQQRKHALDKKLKLKHHTQTRKRYKCDECEFGSSNQYRLESHKDEKHTPTHLQKFLYCAECKYKTQKIPALKKHMNIKHMSIELKTFLECDHCDFKTEYKYNLKLHIKRRHIPDLNMK